MNGKHERKKRMGRPPLDMAMLRRNRIDLRLTDAELDMVKREAQRRGITITDLLLDPFRKEK